MNFEIIIVVLTFITGVMWVLDRLLWRKKRIASATTDQEKHRPWHLEITAGLFPVLLAVLIIRSFWFEPFRIPSGSMIPTLLVGDFVVVNKYKYGLRVPVSNKKFIPVSEPKRGDIAVFRYPQNKKIYFIKRVIGLPGDTVVFKDHQLFINGEHMPMDIKGAYTGSQQPEALKGIEMLNDVKHDVLYLKQPNRFKRQGPEGIYEVPEGYYFMMGDNRDNSEDSRFVSVGFVPEGNMVGKAERIWMHINTHGKPMFRWSRIGDKLH